MKVKDEKTADDYLAFREEIESGVGMWKVNKCFTSTMLVFNIPQSQILRCVLDKYGEEEFVNCLEEDSKFDGAYCIKDALENCFQKHGIHNDLSPQKESFDNGSGKYMHNIRTKH